MTNEVKKSYPHFGTHVVLPPEQSMNGTSNLGRKALRTSFSDGTALCGYHSPAGGWSLSRHLPHPMNSPKQEGIYPSVNASSTHSLTLGLVRCASLSHTPLLQSSSVTGLGASASTRQPLQASCPSPNPAEVEVTSGHPKSFVQAADDLAPPSPSVPSVPASPSLARRTEIQVANARAPQRRSCITPARKQTPPRGSVRVDSLGPNARLIRLPQCAQIGARIEAGRPPSRGPSRGPFVSGQDSNPRAAKGSTARPPDGSRVDSACSFVPPSRVEKNARLLRRLPSDDTGRSTPGSATINRREAAQNRQLNMASKRLADSPRNKNWAPILTENPRAPCVAKVSAMGPLAAATARLRSSSTAKLTVRTPIRAQGERTPGTRPLLSRRDSGLVGGGPSYAASTFASKAKQREIVEIKRVSQRPSPEASLNTAFHAVPNPKGDSSHSNDTAQRQHRAASPHTRDPSPQMRRPSQKSQAQERRPSPHEKRPPASHPQAVRAGTQRPPSPRPQMQRPPLRTAERTEAAIRKQSPQRAKTLSALDRPDGQAPIADVDGKERRRFHPARRNTLTNIGVRGIRGVAGTQSGPRQALLRRSGSTVTSRVCDQSSESKAPQPSKSADLSHSTASNASPVTLVDAPSSSTPVRLNAPTWDDVSRLSDVITPLDHTLTTIKSGNLSPTLVSPVTLGASSSAFSSIDERKESPAQAAHIERCIFPRSPCLITPTSPNDASRPSNIPLSVNTLLAETEGDAKAEISDAMADTAHGSLDSTGIAADSPNDKVLFSSASRNIHSPTGQLARDTIASPLGRISPRKKDLRSPSIPTSVPVVALTPILSNLDRVRPYTPEGARDKLTQWYESREEVPLCEIGVADVNYAWDGSVQLASPANESMQLASPASVVLDEAKWQTSTSKSECAQINGANFSFERREKEASFEAECREKEASLEAERREKASLEAECREKEASLEAECREKKASLEEEYREKEASLEAECRVKEASLEAECREKEASLEAECREKEASLEACADVGAPVLTAKELEKQEGALPGDVSPSDLGSIDPMVWSFMESRYKQTGLWTQKKSHPCASQEEIRVLTEILDREWEAADFDWHESPEELESNVRYSLRYGGDQVCVVVGDIFCQGMNKFVTLKREGTSVTIFWPSSLRIQANVQRMF